MSRFYSTDSFSVERAQLGNSATHQFLHDILHDNAIGIAFAGHFDEMPLSAIRAAQNFHRVEFLDNVEKAKTYANRAAESRKIADKAFDVMTKLIALQDPTALSDEERLIQAKYSELYQLLGPQDARRGRSNQPPRSPSPIEVDGEAEMQPPDLD